MNGRKPHLALLPRFKARLKGLRMPMWAKVLAPVLLGAWVLFILTDIIYYSGKRESLAALAEGYFIRLSIRYAEEHAKNPGAVAVISVKESDYQQLPHAPSPLIRDLSIENYAEVLAKVAGQNPRLIVISWLMGAHQLNETYLEPVTKVIDQLGIADRTMIALPFVLTGPIPEGLRQKYQFRDADDCVYEINAFCSVVKEWDWIIQGLIDRLWINPPPSHISTNLPHALPNTIANVPEEESIPEYSFDEILHDRVHLKPNAVVMIGNAVRQDLQFRGSKYVIQRTFTAGSTVIRDLISDGTTFHKFWAQLAQMFIDRTTVGVPDALTTRTYVVITSAILFLAIVKFNLATGFAVLLFYSFFLPFLNVINVRYFKIYLPIFDVIYAGLIVYIASAFSLVSIRSYQRWRLEERQKSLAMTADLKSNFISLISHNLNTPVAKLRGLVDILQQGAHEPKNSRLLQQVSLLIGRLQLCIRSVLMSTSLEEGAIHPASTTLRAFIQEFQHSIQLTLKRMGIAIKIEPDPTDESLELWYTPFVFDVKIVAQAIGAMAALGIGGLEDLPTTQWTLQFDTDKENAAGQPYLRTVMSIDPSPVADLTMFENHSKGSAQGNFFDTTQLTFLKLAAIKHGGWLEFANHNGALIVTAFWLNAGE